MREQTIFTEALEHHDPADRAAYLDRACGPDAALRQRVEKLLRRFEQTGDFLESPVPVRSGPLDDLFAEAAGSVIGPYKLLEQIGEGGMGIVFMAEQSTPVRRKVALKIIKPGMDTRQVVARFEAERQALAMMEHPSIARVLDAGATGSLRPYFVMELVRGVPITEYCDAHRLTIDDRLDLFIRVCRAVQHAHQKGIIHRDLKPSNVLVTVQDGEAVPKVIDFGIAKATGQLSLTDKTLFTGFAQLLGTPLYMSPEQAELSGTDVDTRSDIYSLGVLLYELLTGTTPFDSDTLRRAALDEVRRIIREQDPPTPSTRLITLGDTRTAVAANRQTEARKLNHSLRGELDWIAMKALEKDRRRRYETAAALADDLRRYRDDEPVEAGPPSARYRLRKFAHRHRTAALVGCLLSLSLIVGTAASTYLAIRARDAEFLAEGRLVAETRERERAVQAENEGRRRLFEAKLAQARAARWSGRVGRRSEGLAALMEAARLGRELGVDPETRLDLRNEAIACLGLVDLRLDRKWDGYPPGSTTTGIAFDAEIERYAMVERRADADDIVIRRLSDNREVGRIVDIGAQSPHLRQSLAFSPDGRLLAAGGDGPVPLRVWELDGSRLVLSAEAAGGFERTFQFSPDGRTLAARGPDEKTVRLFDVAGRVERDRFHVDSRIQTLFYHPAGDRLALCGEEQVFILDLASRAELAAIRVADSQSRDAAWSPDGCFLAIARADGNVEVRDIRTHALKAKCEGHDSQVIGVAFSPDGRMLMSSSEYDTRLWDSDTGRAILGANGSATAFSRDGRRLGLGLFGPYVGRWNVEPAESFRSTASGPPALISRSLRVHPDGELIADATDDGVRLWHAPTARMIANLPIGTTTTIHFEPGGRSLITSGHFGPHRWPIRRVSEAAGDRFRIGPPRPIELPPGASAVRASFSVDGTRAVSRAGADRAVIFNLNSPGSPILPIQPAHDLAMSTDGRWVATGVENAYEGKLWDAETGRWLRDFTGMRTSSPIFSPDNRWLIFATAQDYLFYRVGTWQPGVRIRRDYGGYYPGPISFPLNGGEAAVTDTERTVRLVDPETGGEFATLSAPVAGEVKTLAFTPGGDRLVAGIRDGSTQFWDLRRIREHLAAMGLDWDRPPYATSSPRDVGPLSAVVDAGDFDRERPDTNAVWFDKLIESRIGYARGNPNDPGGQHRLGNALSVRGRFDEAIRAYEEALRLDPRDRQALQGLARILADRSDAERRDVPRAIEVARRAIADEPFDQFNRLTLGLALLRAGRSEEAELELRQGWSLLPPDSDYRAEAEILLAICLWRQGRQGEARRFRARCMAWLDRSGPGKPGWPRVAVDSTRRYLAEAEALMAADGAEAAPAKPSDRPG